MTDINKAFGIICDKVYEPLKAQGFTKEKAAGAEGELVALFTGESVAYSVVYFTDKMHVVLRSCTMTDEGPDNQWKTMSTWMFNPETDTIKEAESIGNDFFDAVSSVAAVRRVKQTKKKKSDDGNADPLFLAKRFMTYFPELKADINYEQNNFESFRGVYFMRTYVIPKLNEMLMRGNKNEIRKLFQMLSTQYTNGDMDTRSIITVVILNGIEEKYLDVITPYLSEELQNAHKYALKFKGKKVRPEKPKKSLAAYAADRLTK